MDRVVEPELLDELRPGDPRAIGSRRDLQRLNALMANVSHLAGALAEHSSPRRVMDLGAGDGAVSLALVRKLGWTNTEFVLVDRVPTVSAETVAAFQQCGCTAIARTGDVLDGLGMRVDITFANLFLHHFTGPQLIRLLAEVAQRCAIFAACEPRRSTASLLASRCVGVIGCNDVTRHDAVASVRAGFSGDELSLLWPGGGGWRLREQAAGLFGHLFVAKKL